MRLYYMTKLDTATRFILPERRIRLSRFHRLNDPFELFSFKMSGKNRRKIFRELIDHWSENIGVICMGKHWTSPLMWAHYADSHQGVCLGFDVRDEKSVYEVNYEPERMEYLIDQAQLGEDFGRKLRYQVLTTKFSHWKYEEEWRLFSTLKYPDTDGEFHLDFGPDFSLKEIIVGTRCKAPVGSFRKLLGHLDHSVTIIKARPAFESFTMVRQNLVSAIVVSPKGKKKPLT